jgi:hypothetical protein
MKKLLFFSLFISFKMFGQAVTIVPSNGQFTEFLKIKKNGLGLDHRTVDNLVGVGTFAAPNSAYIQTHTPHSLHFSTNNADPFMTITYSATASLNGNVGIGTYSPTQKLQVNGRVRFMHNGETAGVWLNNAVNSTSTADGAFIGLKNDNESGFWIGNAWRFWVNSAGEINSTALAGTGNRSILATSSGVLIANATPQVWSIAGSAFSSNSTNVSTFVKASTVAYYSSGNGTMTAPVNLPNGAKITEIKLFYQDTSTSSFSINLYAQNLQNDSGAATSLSSIASFTSSDVVGIQSANLALATNSTINNSDRAYYFTVNSSEWDSYLTIKSIKITYTL